MPIDKRGWIPATAVLLAVFLAAGPLRAATIEVESEDEAIGATPTPAAPASAPAKAAAPSKPSAPVSSAPLTQQAPSNPAPSSSVATKRVRVSDNVGFYYFVKAGYLADPDSVPSLAHVVGSFDNNMNYSFPKKTFIEADSGKVKFQKDDLLVVYRTVEPADEPHTGSLGYQVENLAIVRVLETQSTRYLVEVVKSFEPFKAGDKVESYDNEIQRWKQAQIKKPLPSQPVTCYVVGGWTQGEQQTYNQAEFIYLSAGTKQGVVEGQAFRLFQVTDTGLMDESPRLPVGDAQVIFAGSDSSTARILRNSVPIDKGFEADYQP